MGKMGKKKKKKRKGYGINRQRQCPCMLCNAISTNKVKGYARM